MTRYNTRTKRNFNKRNYEHHNTSFQAPFPHEPSTVPLRLRKKRKKDGKVKRKKKERRSIFLSQIFNTPAQSVELRVCVNALRFLRVRMRMRVRAVFFIFYFFFFRAVGYHKSLPPNGLRVRFPPYLCFHIFVYICLKDI